MFDNNFGQLGSDITLEASVFAGLGFGVACWENEEVFISKGRSGKMRKKKTLKI